MPSGYPFGLGEKMPWGLYLCEAFLNYANECV